MIDALTIFKTQENIWLVKDFSSSTTRLMELKEATTACGSPVRWENAMEADPRLSDG